MMAINRHTLTPSGWVHEQDNFKRVSATGEVLCREVGLITSISAPPRSISPR